MDAQDLQPYFILAGVTSIWCALHSILISVTVTRFLHKHASSYVRFFRILFNIIALLTLLPVILYQRSLATRPFFNWDGYFHLVQIAMIILGILCFYLGARKYDAGLFLGITQIKDDRSPNSLNSAGMLDTSGIHAVIRHPWYTGLLLVLWARPLDISTVIINVIFSLYLIVGTWLEERKLVMEYGDSYRAYQKNVSMLLPFKWLISRLQRN
jgi:protein-S-isoprenylcysteine O-methyltransferase Ste14